MLRLYSARNLPEAHLVRQLLGHAGIPARVLNENLQSVMGELPANDACPQVWLDRDRDLERARVIVRDYEHDGESAPPRHCPACGEENPGNFQLCWQCSAQI